jgi:hypothetical protein
MQPFLAFVLLLHVLLSVYPIGFVRGFFEKRFRVNERIGESSPGLTKSDTASSTSLDKTQKPVPKGIKPQFVLISFDGSKNLEMWEETRRFAREMTGAGKPLHFTYFISGVYFLPPNKAYLYHPPLFPPGTSRIGFSDTPAEIPSRVEEVKEALKEGNEIASHLSGHFAAGSLWGKGAWTSEITQFKSLLSNVGPNAGSPEIEFPNLGIITGIRTPNLSKNLSLYESLGEAGFTYDSSYVGKPNDLPYKIGKIWEVPLKDIPLWGTKQTVISMDYNFWSRQSDAKDIAKKGTALYNKFHDQMLKSYQEYFSSVYSGNRAPVVIGHHFSLWNDGVYWQALKDFVAEVCGIPDVYCTTFSTYVNYLNSTGK